MIRKITLKIKSSSLARRVLWTLFIVAIYMLGRHLPVPLVPINAEILEQNQLGSYFENLIAVTGGSISQLNLFSLGLSPWMSSMIIWRFLMVFKIIKQVTSKQAKLNQMYLALAIATLQGYGVTMNLDFSSFDWLGVSQPLIPRIFTIVFLVAGVFVMIWLGNLNAVKGIGAMMIFILINLILTFVKNIYLYFSGNNFSTMEFIFQGLLFTVVISLLILTSVTVYRAEYRIKIRRVSLNGYYASESYIPIRITPAAGMPFMYGMTLMILPPIIIGLFLNFFPGNATLVYLSGNLRLSALPGIVAYLILLFVLSIGFAYYNYDAYDIARNMRNNGDYIEHLRPGKETQRYLQDKITKLAYIGGFYTMLVAGVPLLFVVGNTDATSIALLVSNAFIITSLLLGIVEQVQTLRMWKLYGELI